MTEPGPGAPTSERRDPADPRADGATAAPPDTGHRSREERLAGARLLVGYGLVALGAAVGLGSLALAAVSDQMLLVLGEATLGRPALVGLAVVAGAGLALGSLLAEGPGPLHPVAKAVGIGAALGLLPLLGFAVPLVGFFVLVILIGASTALLAPVPFLVLVAVSCTAAVLLVRRARGTPDAPSTTEAPGHPWGRLLVTSVLVVCTSLATVAGLGWAISAADDDVVVAHEPGGCTAVVRQTQLMFTGEAVLYVAAPGSVVAHRRDTFPLEESFPFRTEEHVLDAGPRDVRIAFDSGVGSVDRTVTCR